jgi:basic membrane protein A
MGKYSTGLRVLCIVGFIAALVAGCAPQAQPTPAPAKAVKVVVLFPGTIADGGWNGLAYKGLEQLKSEGFETAYTDDGYNLIIGNGWQMSTAFVELAPEYPNTKFFVMSTAPQGTIPSNLQFVFGSPHKIAYATGALAALISTSHAVGFVGGGDNPAQRALGNGFKQGAEETVPGTKANIIITGDYNDASKGREAALTLIGNGADVVWHAADITGLGVLTAGIDKGIIVIGCYSDQTSMWYPSFATSVVQALDYTTHLKGIEVREGTFKGGGTWEPAFTEMYHFQAGTKTYNDQHVPAAVQTKIDQIIADIKSGKINVPYNTQ